MRQLSDVEKELNKKAINRLKNRNKDVSDYYIKKTTLELEVGLPISINKTRLDYKKAIREWKSEVDGNEKQIQILQDQINKGVEPKGSNIAG